MTESLWPSPSAVCQVRKDHRPEPLLLARHHIVPASWAGGPGEAGETLVVCYGCHTDIHVLLDDLVYGRPMRSPRSLAARWALEGWNRALVAGATPKPTL